MRTLLTPVLKLTSFMVFLSFMGYLCWCSFPFMHRGHRTPKPVVLKTIYRVGHNQPWPTLRAALMDLPRKIRYERGNPPVRIILEDDIREVDVVIEFHSNVTIEAAEGKKITWTLPPNLPDAPSSRIAGHRLCWIDSSANLRLKGLTLDGNNRIDNLIVLNKYCPATTLENITLKGFKKYGIVAGACQGDEEASRHVLLRRLTFETSQLDQAGIIFTRGLHLSINRFISFQDCNFLGPGVKIKTHGNLDMLSDIQFPAGVHPLAGSYSGK